ncbi:MAG: radical SAM protein [Candidatus Woesearchaeota archaeon]
MTVLEFENFSFHEHERVVSVLYAKRYKFTIDRSELEEIDQDVSIMTNALEFPSVSEKKASNKVNRIIDRGLDNLTHVINGKNVIFIDEYSGIPLLGSGEFGVVDRNTNVLELKPMTGCNLNCIYCSVDEGQNKKEYDILIDPYYLAQTALEIASYKEHAVEFNIGPHGEPLLYPFLEELVTELRRSPKTNTISVNTNGTLLTRELIDRLKAAGLGRINLSLNSLDKEVSSKISGKTYPLDHVLDMIEYCKKIGFPVLLAPLVIPTYTDNPKRDIEPLVKLAKTIKSPYPTIGFQNYLVHKHGRKPVKTQMEFEEFFSLLKPFEKEYGITLTPKADYNPFGIYEDKTLEKPMHKNQVVTAEVKSPGRHANERLCVAKGRIITVKGLDKEKGSVRVKIIRDKHNIFLGAPA